MVEDNSAKPGHFNPPALFAGCALAQPQSAPDLAWQQPDGAIESLNDHPGVSPTPMFTTFHLLPGGSFEIVIADFELDFADAWRQTFAQRQLLFRPGTIGAKRIFRMV